MKVTNFFKVSSVLTKLDTAYRNATNVQFKKLWLNKWNEYAKDNCNGALGKRDYDTEKKFENQMLNN
tara:strand:- start:1397 stop:1597 length:201 start_codon:yes stop_codon:yes gene_type:complete